MATNEFYLLHSEVVQNQNRCFKKVSVEVVKLSPEENTLIVPAGIESKTINVIIQTPATSEAHPSAFLHQVDLLSGKSRRIGDDWKCSICGKNELFINNSQILSRGDLSVSLEYCKSCQKSFLGLVRRRGEPTGLLLEGIPLIHNTIPKNIIYHFDGYEDSIWLCSWSDLKAGTLEGEQIDHGQYNPMEPKRKFRTSKNTISKKNEKNLS